MESEDSSCKRILILILGEAQVIQKKDILDTSYKTWLYRSSKIALRLQNASLDIPFLSLKLVESNA